MEQPIQLVSIPEQSYSDYRYDVIFNAYKWDPQVEDHNTVSRQAVLIDAELADQLKKWAEMLAEETVRIETAMMRTPFLFRELGIPREISGALKRMSGYEPQQHVRLMRFDFHPTADGWAVSEVNSDVPGGFAEASALPGIAAGYFAGYEPGADAAAMLAEAFRGKIKSEGTVAFVHATSYADDRQVMQCLSDAFAAQGYHTCFAAPDHIRWVSRRAFSILEGQEGEVDGIVRFFPLEWLANLPRRTRWRGYFEGTTPSCNHPVAMFAQSKRLPLVWDRLGVDHAAWKQLLPETKDPKHHKNRDGWLYKPALGRVGEGISVKGVVSPAELKQIEKAAHREHRDWVAQRMFESVPLQTETGAQYHLCIGVFTISGKYAGFYGRISAYPRIDANAEDIPVLIRENGKGGKNER